MVQARFPLQSKFQFTDEKGKKVFLDSPSLHLFLLQMFNRLGGTSTDSVADLQGDVSSSQDSITTLTLKTANLELLEATKINPTTKSNLSKYIWSGVL